MITNTLEKKHEECNTTCGQCNSSFNCIRCAPHHIKLKVPKWPERIPKGSEYILGLSGRFHLPKLINGEALMMEL